MRRRLAPGWLLALEAPDALFAKIEECTAAIRAFPHARRRPNMRGLSPPVDTTEKLTVRYELGRALQAYLDGELAIWREPAGPQLVANLAQYFKMSVGGIYRHARFARMMPADRLGDLGKLGATWNMVRSGTALRALLRGVRHD